MSESLLDQDEKVLEELASQKIEGLTPRGKIAISDLANENQGAAIFLFISLNSRIRDLEEALLHGHVAEDKH